MSPVLLLLATLLSPDAAAEPVRLGAEGLVSILRTGNAVNLQEQSDVHVVPGDDAYLVVWTDTRGEYPSYNGFYPPAGSAMRVGMTGALLDPVAISLPFAPQAVVWNGTHWIMIRDTGYVRISRQGELLDAKIRPFAKRLGIETMPAVWTGSAIVIAVRSGFGSFGRLYAAAFDADMNPLGEASLLEPADDGGHVFAIASNGDSALILYSDLFRSTKPVYTAMFNRNGVLESRRTINVTVPREQAALAAVGDGYLVAFHDTSTQNARYLTFHIDRNNDHGLTPLGPFGPTTVRHLTAAPAMLWKNGTATLFPVVGVNPSVDARLGAFRFSATGEYQSESPLLPWSYGSNRFPSVHAPVIASLKDSLLLASIDYPTNTSGRGVLNVRVTANAETLAAAPPKNVIVNVLPQETPVVAMSATQSLIVWRERVNDLEPLTLYATRAKDDGTILDMQSIRIATDTSNGQSPAVASDGRDFLVAWADAGGIRSALVSAAGTAGEPVRIAETTMFPATTDVAVASNGSGYLVAWTTSFGGGYEVRAARVGADGKLVDPVPIAFGGIFPRPFPRVTTDGRSYLLAWNASAARIDASGSVLVAPDRVLLGAGIAEAVWWSGASYGVWMREEWPSGYRLVRLGTNAAVLSSTAVPGVSLQTLDRRVFVCRGRSCSAPVGSGLVRVDDDGQAFTVATVALDPNPPARLATLLAGVSRTLVVYVRGPAEQPFGGVPRVFVRPLAPIGRTRAVRH